MDIFEIKQRLFNAYYRELNEQQREAVFCVNGPLLVLAGAGSGKTTVLVNRIAHIIRFGNAYRSETAPALSDGEKEMLEAFALSEDAPREMLEPILAGFADNPCPPWQILAITFTNKAAGEIKERLSRALGERANEIWAGTFHSVCVRLLRQFAEYTPFGRDFLIYDQDDGKKVIAAILKEREIDPDDCAPKTVLAAISNAKNALLSPADYLERVGFSEKKKLIGELYEAYQSRLRDANALDFDDILSEAVALLRDHEEPLAWCRNKFRYLLVDEYQDTNRAQYLFIKMIADKSRNIMVVGDDDQSIYKFRGAAVENILTFDRNFPDARVIFLEQNYRSTQNIIGAANAVIAHNESRRGKTLWCSQKAGKKVSLRAWDDQEKEALAIADRILSSVARGRNYRDFAVLYRTKAQSNALETVFTKSGVPHRLLAGTRFYEHAEVKDVLAYLRVVENPADFVSLGRIVNVPKRGIGAAAMEKVSQIAAREGMTAYRVIQNAGRFEELARSKNKFAPFAELMERLRAFAAGHTPSEILRRVIDESGYLQTLSGAENEEKRNNVQELISSAQFYEQRADEVSLSGFLEEVALVSDVDSYDKSADAVVLMTVHAAKGLEFPVVFLPGLEENLFPSYQSAVTQEDLEEERRLFYVAMTRAKEELYLSCCRARLLYGRTNFNKISRFAEEIPEEYLDSDLSAMRKRSFDEDDFFASAETRDFERFRPAPYRQERSETPPKKAPAPAKTEVFSAGDRVVHSLFGAGVIESAAHYGGDTLYVVKFDNGAIKKLMATYAKLQKEN